MNVRRGGRVLAIGLDGYEQSLGDRLMAAGELPALARLRSRSARFTLDHGPAQRTGLAWEQVASGLSPEDAARWSAVTFDTRTYEAWQEGTSLTPFTSTMQSRAVVFDTPYFDLERAPSTLGVVGWGAHDPGVDPNARPASLGDELVSRFGQYPAEEWLYGIVWPSAERARVMGEALAHATDVRARAAHWLLAERLPDWRLGLVVAGELHSAIEGLWHGVDPAHLLRAMPSARPAGEGLRAVYRAADRLVGSLTDAFSDATIVVFAMGGMGPNLSDVASMILLPELLYRHAFGSALLEDVPAWADAAPLPMLGEDENWSIAVNAHIPRRVTRTTRLQRAAARLRNLIGSSAPDAEDHRRKRIPWIPATHYQPYWSAMRFFALPSFYDGRIRINLEGRERLGKVPLAGYGAACAEVEDLVRSCRDSRTGEPVVDFVERYEGDPLRLDATSADLVFVWRTASVALDHPLLGRIGPVPFRRSGGHTGRYGMAYVGGDGITSGDFGVRSSFDVVPTLVELVGETVRPDLSGRSLFTPATNALVS